MNCKPGDLAVVASGVNAERSRNIGRICSVIRFIGYVEGWVGTDRWEIDIEVIGTKGTLHRHIRDAYLKPIRDNDGEDETLQWSGKPQEVTA